MTFVVPELASRQRYLMGKNSKNSIPVSYAGNGNREIFFLQIVLCRLNKNSVALESVFLVQMKL